LAHPQKGQLARGGTPGDFNLEVPEAAGQDE